VLQAPCRERCRTRRNHRVRRAGFRTVFCDDPTWSDAARACLSWCRRRTLEVGRCAHRSHEGSTRRRVVSQRLIPEGCPGIVVYSQSSVHSTDGTGICEGVDGQARPRPSGRCPHRGVPDCGGEARDPSLTVLVIQTSMGRRQPFSSTNVLAFLGLRLGNRRQEGDVVRLHLLCTFRGGLGLLLRSGSLS